MTKAARSGIRAILEQGGDPVEYRHGLASTYELPIETIDAMIAEAGTPEPMSRESQAEATLSMARRWSRQGSRAARTYHHEED